MHSLSCFNEPFPSQFQDPISTIAPLSLSNSSRTTVSQPQSALVIYQRHNFIAHDDLISSPRNLLTDTVQLVSSEYISHTQLCSQSQSAPNTKITIDLLANFIG